MKSDPKAPKTPCTVKGPLSERRIETGIEIRHKTLEEKQTEIWDRFYACAKEQSLMAVRDWLILDLFNGDHDLMLRHVKHVVHTDRESGAIQGLRWLIYTDSHEYSLYASAREDGTAYLGGGASNRKARIGERHQRGCDLPDGDLTEDTWRRIRDAMLAHELKPLW